MITLGGVHSVWSAVMTASGHSRLKATAGAELSLEGINGYEKHSSWKSSAVVPSEQCTASLRLDRYVQGILASSSVAQRHYEPILWCDWWWRRWLLIKIRLSWPVNRSSSEFWNIKIILHGNLFDLILALKYFIMEDIKCNFLRIKTTSVPSRSRV